MSMFTRDGQQVTISGSDDDAEVSAALAAVLCVLDGERGASLPAETARQRWSESQRVAVQGVAASRLPARPTWNAVERLRRAGRGGSGITGF